MSDPAVTAYVTKLLCAHGGRLERDRLADVLDLPAPQIEQILQEESDRFPQTCQVVLARSPLRICHLYLNPAKGCPDGEGQCPKLHLCRQYLRGHCPPNRRPSCRFSHDIHSDQNRSVLKANQLIGLNEEEIKILLFQNDSGLLLEICSKYMDNECEQGEACPRLHLCRHFARGQCYNRFCKRSHNLLNCTLLLSCKWLSAVSAQSFQMLCEVKHNERHQQNWNEDRRQAARSRGRGRGRGRGRRGRDKSQDLLESRSRERRSEEPQFHQRTSSSRASSVCSQRSGDEDYDNSTSDHEDRQETRLKSLMEGWFETATPQLANEKATSSSAFSAVNPRLGPRSEPDTSSKENRPKPLLGRPVYNPNTKPTTASPSTSTVDDVPSNKANVTQNTIPSSSTGASRYNQTRFTPDFACPVPPAGIGSSKPQSPLTAETPKAPLIPSSTSNRSMNFPPDLDLYNSKVRDTASPITSKVNHIPSNNATVAPSSVVSPSKEPSYYTNTRVNPSSVSPKPSTATGFSNVFSPLPAEPPMVPSTPSSTSNRSMNLSATDLSMVSRPKSSTASYIPDNSITRSPSSPSVTVQYKTGSPTAGLPNTSPTPSSTSKASLTSHAEPEPAEILFGSFSSSLNPSYLSNVWRSPNTGVVDPPSKKLQASVKPISKSDAPSDIIPNRDIKEVIKTSEDCSPKPTPRSKASQPEPSRSIPSVPPKTVSVAETPVICLHQIWKYCKLGGKCPDMHYYLPYRWQMLDGTDWKDLPYMEDMEKAYSDPNNDGYQSINFQLMRSGARCVRRLSTASSVTLPSEYVLTTEWVWYWKDESGNWIQYGQKNPKNMSANLLASDLENIYLSNPTNTIQFSAGNQSYTLNFQEMRQRNNYYCTEREVRRRPKFLDFDNVKMLKGSTKSAATLTASPVRMANYPDEWNMEGMLGVEYKKVPVAESSREFSTISAMFGRTMPGHKVKTLWRVQNPNLWQAYQWQKNQMKSRNSGLDVKESRLFHGTTSANTERICKDNLDWRVCGTNGTVYGQGSYFARDASYSHSYATGTPGGTHTMFVARVLVGDFVKGDSTMRRPPEKQCGGQSYDSCVDNVLDPSIYVVFEKFQIYPEFILEYKADKNCTMS